MTSILTQTPTSWRFYHRSLVHPSGIQPLGGGGGQKKQDGRKSTVTRERERERGDGERVDPLYFLFI